MAGTCACSRIPRWPSRCHASRGRCARYALQLARRTLAPVHLVGHSLGGLVIYRMFETGLLAPDRFSGDFCRVVFMGTPVRGSQSGRTLARLTPLRRLLGAAGTEELLSELPRRWAHKAQLGVIAGDSPRGLGRLITRLDGPNDGTVAVSETAIEGATDRCVVHASHMGMLIAPESRPTDRQFPRGWSFRTAFDVSSPAKGGRRGCSAEGGAGRQDFWCDTRGRRPRPGNRQRDHLRLHRTQRRRQDHHHPPDHVHPVPGFRVAVGAGACFGPAGKGPHRLSARRAWGLPQDERGCLPAVPGQVEGRRGRMWRMRAPSGCFQDWDSTILARRSARIFPRACCNACSLSVRSSTSRSCSYSTNHSAAWIR